MPASTAVTTITQGTESTYGILAGTTVTNTGPSQISGTAGSDIGVSPGSAIATGISIGTGIRHSNDAAAIAAKVAQSVTNTLLGDDTGLITVPSELGGTTLIPGAYEATAGLNITGTLTLDAGGFSEKIFVFKTPSTLVTATSSRVVLINGAQACNVYWQVGSSATLGSYSKFVGQIYAATSITANTRAAIRGQLLPYTGAVTLQSNIIVNDSCGPETAEPAEIADEIPSFGGGYTAPAPVQSSSIASISTAVCSASAGYIAVMMGTFPTAVANIAVNGSNVDTSRWSQSATSVSVQIPATEAKSFTIDVYNGLTPMLASQTFLCTDAVVVPVVVPTETPTEIPVVVTTEVGGELPITSTNNYNNLLAGIGISLLGGSGVLLRKRTQK